MLTRVYSVTLAGIAITLLMCIVTVNPMYCCGYCVSLPVTQKPDLLLALDQLPQLTIKFDRTVYLNQYWVPEDELLGELKKNRKDSLVLLVDTRLSFGTVRKVVRTMQESGTRQIFIMTYGERSAVDLIATSVSRNLEQWASFASFGRLLNP